LTNSFTDHQPIAIDLMSRHIPERRRRPTRCWDVFTTAGRRSAPRRSGDLETPPYYVVDRHGPATGVLVVLVLLFTLADGVLTLLLLDHSCEEANPLMAYLVERGPLWFLGGKYLLTALGLAVFLVLKYYRLFGTRFRPGHLIPILAGLYVVLLVYQLTLFGEAFRSPQPSGRGRIDSGLPRTAAGPPHLSAR
jgi:Domain of unknown function (DUF5658)